MKILISAAEASSDAHGAELLKALRRLEAASGNPENSIDAFGIGGPKLEAAGLRVIFPARELLAMGFFEIFSRLPRIFDALRTLADAAGREKPDVAVVIDYPDFHFRLARRLKTLGVPVVYYIPPKVWVWRKKRLRVLRELFARILCILPFEEEFYRRENVNARYVGNPLVDELPLEMSREEARQALKIGHDEKVLVVMPGSRPSELKRHMALLLDGVQRAVALLRGSGAVGATENVRVLMPFPETSSTEDAEERVQKWLEVARPGGMDVRISRGNAATCLRAADAGVVKSGTSTLEAALLGCPQVVVYRPNAFTCFVFNHLIRYRGPVGLVNLVAGTRQPPYLATELLCRELTAKSLSEEVVRLFTDPATRERLSTGMRELRSKLLADPAHRHPSSAAAEEVLSLLAVRR